MSGANTANSDSKDVTKNLAHGSKPSDQHAPQQQKAANQGARPAQNNANIGQPNKGH